jgi:DNA-binding XRE family transcriptional regulator
MESIVRSEPLSDDEAADEERIREQIEREKPAIAARIRRHMAERRRQEAAAAGMLTLGQRVRAARQARGVSQTTLAAEARVSQGYLSQIERDLREPTLSVAARLARALRMSIDELALGRG